LRRRGFSVHASASDLWPATSNPTQLEPALLNLAIYSRDAMPTRGRLRVVTSNVHEADFERPGTLDPDDYVRIAVIDSGTGMLPDIMARAFEPFFITKEIGEGSGLGLAQVYGVATQFGRTARLACNSEGGTTAEVFLLRTTIVQAVIATSEPQAMDAVMDGGIVLVVDNDPDAREIAVTFLREAGYVVEEAGDGPKARNILSARPVCDEA
jgi:hypothetical protein